MIFILSDSKKSKTFEVAAYRQMLEIIWRANNYKSTKIKLP